MSIFRLRRYSTGVPYSSLVRAFCSTEGPTFSAKCCYTPEEYQKILDTLNISPPDILSRYKLSKAKIKSFHDYMEQNGPFKSLDEVLEVEGFKDDYLQELCRRILTNKLSKPRVGVPKSNKFFKHLLEPEIDKEFANKIQTGVAIHLDPTGVGWASINRECNVVSDWKCHNLTLLPSKMLPSETFHLAIDLLKMTPVGDVYILEAPPQLNPQNQSKQVVTHKHQIELMSMMLALLNTSVKHNKGLQGKALSGHFENRVFYLKNRVSARLFRTLIGFEKVSAVSTIVRLLRKDLTVLKTLPCGLISFNTDLSTKFFALPPSQKELQAQALMLAVTFMDLCVNKNKNSCATLTEFTKNDNKSQQDSSLS